MVVFARPRHEYSSYVDFWRLVELSGYPVCYVDQIDLTADEVFVTAPLNGDFLETIAYRKSTLQRPQRARLVLWYLERPDSLGTPLSASSIQQLNSENLRHVDHLWVSDRHLASLDDRTTFAVLGGHPGLLETASEAGQPDFDYAVMSYITRRREKILSNLWDLRLAPNSWGVERSRALSRTKVMLNIHQTEAPLVEPLRFALSAAYGLTLVSEYCADPFPLVPGTDFVMCGYDGLAQATRDWVKNPEARRLQDRLRGKLTSEWTFRRGVESALKEMLSAPRQ